MAIPDGDARLKSTRFFPNWDIYGPYQLHGFIHLCLDICKLGDELVGVEIGSFYGESANLLLSFPQIKKLTCVDPYIQPYLKTRLKDSILGGRLNTNQMTSVEAVSLFEDESLDFVYIDGDHSYEAVVSDIAAWYPKLKTNGLLCGHDYIPESNQLTVVKAVDEFFNSKQLELKRYQDSSWSGIKLA